MSNHSYPIAPEGFLQWMEESGIWRNYNDLYYRYVKVLDEKLSIGITELPQDHYSNLLDGWRYDRFAALHKYISNLFADRTSDLIRELFDGDEELAERARQEFRTAIDQYGRFVRGVSPKPRQKAAFFRQHFFDNYVDQARQSGQSGFTIKTLDVIRDLNVIHDKVNVSETALKAKFKKDANVVYDGEEPKPADELILKFRFLDRAEEEISSPSLYERTKTMRPPSLNQVFYGPPGAGKTYRTSQEAVRICDGEVSEDRTVYMERYNKLMEHGRIEFVTFHQSFSYEDFVEGLRPYVSSELSSSGGFRLRVRNGVFKRTEKSKNSRSA